LWFDRIVNLDSNADFGVNVMRKTKRGERNYMKSTKCQTDAEATKNEIIARSTRTGCGVRKLDERLGTTDDRVATASPGRAGGQPKKFAYLVASVLATLVGPQDARVAGQGGFGSFGFAMMPHMMSGSPFVGHFQEFRDRGPGQEQGNPFFDSNGRPYGSPFGDYASGGYLPNHKWL
jgi:hypothetical protein